MYVTPKKPCIIVMPCLISTQHLGAEQDKTIAFTYE